MSKNIAFVASTLPVQWLNKNLDVCKIDEIIVASAELYESYQFLNKDYKNLRLSVLPSNLILKVFFIFWKIIFTKFSLKYIYFFHECCWVSLDLIIKLIKPKGFFYPQVTMNSFEILTDKKASPFKFFNLFNFFTEHIMIMDVSNKKEIIYSCHSYPKSIKVYNVEARISSAKIPSFSNQVLVLLGSHNCPNEELKKVFEKVVKLFLLNGFTCHIKDHPRADARLNFGDQLKQYSVKIINPTHPAELIKDDYSFVIGISSTALLYYEDRAISIINTVKSIPKEIRENSIQHLLSLPGGNLVNFIEEIQEIEKYIFINKT